MKSPEVLQNKTSLSLASKRLFAIFVVAGLILITYVQMTHFDSRTNARRTVIFVGQDGLIESTADQPMSGKYQVNWKTSGICSYQADLSGISIFSTEGAKSGAEKITLASNRYHIHMIKSQAFDCAWRVRFNP